MTTKHECFAKSYSTQKMILSSSRELYQMEPKSFPLVLLTKYSYKLSIQQNKTDINSSLELTKHDNGIWTLTLETLFFNKTSEE